MRIGKRMLPLILFIANLLLLPIIFLSENIYAVLNDSLRATVKTSICGNEIIEGGEDCEGSDLNNNNCQTIGYDSGTLSCDIACSFDVSLCLISTPTPTPTPTSIPTITPTPTLTAMLTPTTTPQPNESLSDPTPTIALIQESEIKTTVKISPTIFQEPKETLIPFLSIFDTNTDLKVNLEELRLAIGTWVNKWRQSLPGYIASSSDLTGFEEKVQCDINLDGNCNLKDFSVLLFNISQNE